MQYKIISIPLLLFLFMLPNTSISAQFRKVLHSTFEVGTVTELNFDLSGSVEIEAWSGNVIMTETTIFLGNASASMLNHFVEQGRYDVVASDPDSTVIMVITSKTKDREPVKLRRWIGEELKEVEVSENVTIKVFVPEEYEHQDDAKTVWKLLEQELETAPIEQDSVRTKSGSE